MYYIWIMQKNIYEGDVIVVHQGSEPITVVFPGEVKPISISLSPDTLRDIISMGRGYTVVPQPDLAPVGEDENEIIDLVAGFHERFLHPILPTPQMPTKVRAKLRSDLMDEELSEFTEAVQKGDLVGVADALCDLQYVLTGTVLEFGMGSAFMRMFREVHGSNMSKACRTEDDARATIAYYKEQGIASYPHMVIHDDGNHWLIYRVSDNKTLKSVNYQPARLAQFLITKGGQLSWADAMNAAREANPMPRKHIAAKIPYTKTVPESFEGESVPPVRSIELRTPTKMNGAITELEGSMKRTLERVHALEQAEKARGMSTMEFNSRLSDQLTKISEELQEGLKRISGIEKFDERLRNLNERFMNLVTDIKNTRQFWKLPKDTD